MGIYAIWGPPQTGKTTVAIDLAFALSAEGRSVCLISPELYCEAAARLDVMIPEGRGIYAAAKKRGALRDAVCEAGDLLYVLAVPAGYDAFCSELQEDAAKAILEEAEELFDLVLVDCPSHTWSVLAAWALNRADAVLMLTGASSSALMWYKTYRKAAAALEDRSLYVCAELADSYDYKTLHKLLGVRPDVRLPFFPEARQHQALTRTLYDTGGKRGREYTREIDELCSLISEAADEEEAYEPYDEEDYDGEDDE